MQWLDYLVYGFMLALGSLFAHALWQTMTTAKTG